VEALQKIADNHRLKLVYDAAHAFGVRRGEDSLLNYGDLSVLSFHATKVFNTFEGGAVVCRDAEMKRKLDSLKNFGYLNDSVVAPGFNGKLNELQAAFGVLQLKYIDEVIGRTRAIDGLYRQLLVGMPGIRCLAPVQQAGNYCYFPILVESGYPLGRDALHEKLHARDIHTRRYFCPLISELPMYRAVPSAHPANLPVATVITRQVLCLPIYPSLETTVVEEIADLVREPFRPALKITGKQ
jgi:dTDP-4-amino-4,6-dideoxygalactose transaminase